MTEISMPENLPQLKSFRGPWIRRERQLLLACKKCQRKLKDDGDSSGLSKLKKLLKKRSKAAGFGGKLVVIETKCLKVCPRAGVAVCTQAQVGAGLGSIVRSVGDVDLLLAQCARDPVVASMKEERSGELG